MGVVAVVGVEGGVLVGYNRLCGVICGVDLEMFLSEWAALCFLFFLLLLWFWPWP